MGREGLICDLQDQCLVVRILVVHGDKSFTTQSDEEA